LSPQYVASGSRGREFIPPRRDGQARRREGRIVPDDIERPPPPPCDQPMNRANQSSICPGSRWK